MKKLLALLLCVMLFVSVIPTSAFAAAINLKTAYDAMANLNVAYAKLATATAYKNGFDGYNALAKAFSEKTNPNAKAAAEAAAEAIANAGASKISEVKTGRTVAAIFKEVGTLVVQQSVNIGNGVALDAKAAEEKAQNDAKEGAEKEAAKLEESIGKALTAAFESIKIPTT